MTSIVATPTDRAERTCGPGGWASAGWARACVGGGGLDPFGRDTEFWVRRRRRELFGPGNRREVCDVGHEIAGLQWFNKCWTSAAPLDARRRPRRATGRRTEEEGGGFDGAICCRRRRSRVASAGEADPGERATGLRRHALEVVVGGTPRRCADGDGDARTTASSMRSSRRGRVPSARVRQWTVNRGATGLDGASEVLEESVVGVAARILPVRWHVADGVTQAKPRYARAERLGKSATPKPTGSAPSPGSRSSSREGCADSTARRARLGRAATLEPMSWGFADRGSDR